MIIATETPYEVGKRYDAAWSGGQSMPFLVLREATCAEFLASWDEDPPELREQHRTLFSTGRFTYFYDVSVD